MLFRWFLLRLQNAGTLAPVTKAKFEKLVVEDNIKFDDGMVDEFAKKFRNENNKIDLILMLEKYLLLFPDTALPKPKEKKKPKSPKEDKTSQKNIRLSGASKKSGKSSLRASVAKPTEEGNMITSTRISEDNRGSKDISLKDDKRESQTTGLDIIEDILRTSIVAESSQKQVSFKTNELDESRISKEELSIKDSDDKEEEPKKSTSTDTEIPKNLEETAKTDTLDENNVETGNEALAGNVVENGEITNNSMKSMTPDNDENDKRDVVVEVANE